MAHGFSRGGHESATHSRPPSLKPTPRRRITLDRALAGRRGAGLCLLVALLVLCCTACDRAAPRDAATARTPRATIELIIASRDAGSYQVLNELIVPERVHEVVKTLLAVDEFLHANKSLRGYVRETFAVGLSQSICL